MAILKFNANKDDLSHIEEVIKYSKLIEDHLLELQLPEREDTKFDMGRMEFGMRRIEIRKTRERLTEILEYYKNQLNLPIQ